MMQISTPPPWCSREHRPWSDLPAARPLPLPAAASAILPYLWFAPLDMPEAIEPAPGTLGALMADRFEVYKREVVTMFYEEHFSRYSIARSCWSTCCAR